MQVRKARVQLDFTLNSTDELTQLVRKNGIDSWNQLISFIHNLPYGRNLNKKDLKLVVVEKKGTSSSKHALLKKIAELNKIRGVQLILGIYKANKQNTPEISKELDEYGLQYILQARCYLKINKKQVDLTFKGSDFELIQNDILEEIEISPIQIRNFKDTLLKSSLRKWLRKMDVDLNLEQIWSIKEKYILSVTENSMV
ncbi:MAG: hypothetical protein ACK5MZ_07615 [Aestuariibaculum sp.]